MTSIQVTDAGEPDRRGGPRGGVWIAGAFLAAATLSLVHLVLFLSQHRLVLPHWDQWGTVGEVQQLEAGGALLRTLLSQHSEHRIAVPRLLLWADLWWFGGHGILLMIANVTIQALHVALLAALARRLAPSRSIAWTLVGGFTAAAFSSCQLENLVWGFQVQFVGVFACATGGALALLKRYEAQGAARWLGVAVAAGATATFCMANGLLAWPLLVGSALALDRQDRRGATTLALSGAACVTVYLVGFEPVPGHDAPASALSHPVAVLSHWLAYLGNIGGKPLALPLGLVAVLAAVAAGASLARRVERPPAAVIAFALVLFIMGSAALTSTGRFSFGWHQALSSRYTTPTAVLWCLLALLTLERACAARRPRLALCAIGAGAVCLLALMAVKGEFARVRWRGIAEDTRDAAVAALVGAEDAHVYEVLSPDAVQTSLSYLRERRLAAFAGPESTWPGALLRDHFLVAPEPGQGGLGSRPPLDSAGSVVSVSGSVRGHAVPRGLVQLLLVADGRIVGLGRVVGAEGWRGWLRVPATEVSAYAIVRRPSGGEPGLVARLERR